MHPNRNPDMDREVRNKNRKAKKTVILGYGDPPSLESSTLRACIGVEPMKMMVGSDLDTTTAAIELWRVVGDQGDWISRLTATTAFAVVVVDFNDQLERSEKGQVRKMWCSYSCVLHPSAFS